MGLVLCQIHYGISGCKRSLPQESRNGEQSKNWQDASLSWALEVLIISFPGRFTPLPVVFCVQAPCFLSHQSHQILSAYSSWPHRRPVVNQLFLQPWPALLPPLSQGKSLPDPGGPSLEFWLLHTSRCLPPFSRCSRPCHSYFSLVISLHLQRNLSGFYSAICHHTQPRVSAFLASHLLLRQSSLCPLLSLQSPDAKSTGPANPVPPCPDSLIWLLACSLLWRGLQLRSPLTCPLLSHSSRIHLL